MPAPKRTAAPPPLERPSDLPYPSSAAGELTFVTPLAHWSDLVRELGELHRAAGQALAAVMGGSRPTTEAETDLRARLESARHHLNAAAPPIDEHKP